MNQTVGSGTIALSYLVLGIGAIIAMFPLALMVISALKTSAEIVANPLALPSALQWVNFSRAWTDARLGRSLLNSAELTGLTVVLICTTCSMAAYALARQAAPGGIGSALICSQRRRCRSSSICSHFISAMRI
jgi:raffinose/stachyose/melibiose transport system permease protein